MVRNRVVSHKVVQALVPVVGYIKYPGSEKQFINISLCYIAEPSIPHRTGLHTITDS